MSSQSTDPAPSSTLDDGAVTHNTAPTQFAEVDGIRFAYRRFGDPIGTPIVLLQHFMGNLDTYDPAITDALGLEQVDVFGFSMGGFVAQQIALDRPELVRRLVLVGTGPRGGEGMDALDPDVAPLFGKAYLPQDLLWLPIFFSPSEASQAAGRRFLDRIRLRIEDRDRTVSDATVAAHQAAAREWGAPSRASYDYLKAIRHPTLVVNGSNDIVVPTVNSYILHQHLSNAELILFPDSNHGSHFQFTEAFSRYVTDFVDRYANGGQRFRL